MSRMSEDRPEMPIRPDCLFIIVSTSLTVMWSLLAINCTTAGSQEPERVPMTTPSRGVSPIDVSTHLPSTTADMEEPLPKWQMIIFLPMGLTPRNSHTRLLT